MCRRLVRLHGRVAAQANGLTHVSRRAVGARRHSRSQILLVPKLLRAICCAVLMTGRRPIATSCEGTLENALSSQQLHQLQAVEAPKIQSFLSSLISISVCPTLLDNTRARAQIPPFINDHSIERTIREMRLVAPDRPMQSTGTHRPLTIL